MAISPVGALPPARTSFIVPSTIPPVQPVAAPVPLAPAVTVDIQPREQAAAEPTRDPGTDQAPDSAQRNTQRIRIDQDTKAIVYQVVDPSSGEVVVQSPDASILKARAYSDAAAARVEKRDQPFETTA